jgi:hypothetical protein
MNDLGKAAVNSTLLGIIGLTKAHKGFRRRDHTYVSESGHTSLSHVQAPSISQA